MKLNKWKTEMEAKGLRVNMGKTKIMVSRVNLQMLKDSGKYPCSVCRKGVGSNSIYCAGCSHWVHKKCSGVISSLKSNPDYRCSRCKGTARPIDGRPHNDLFSQMSQSFCLHKSQSLLYWIWNLYGTFENQHCLGNQYLLFLMFQSKLFCWRIQTKTHLDCLV